MLIQEKISGSDTLLKLSIAIDEDLKALHPQLRGRQLPRDPRGRARRPRVLPKGSPSWSGARGAGLTDKAKVYFLRF